MNKYSSYDWYSCNKEYLLVKILFGSKDSNAFMKITASQRKKDLRSVSLDLLAFSQQEDAF